MATILITPRTGQFAGQEVFTDNDGRGIFTSRADGTYQQHTGTSQTPKFKTAKQMAEWIKRHYDY
jgi:hypothetical protein